MLYVRKFLNWFFFAVVVGLSLSLLGAHIYYRHFQAPELSFIRRTYAIFSGVNTHNAHIALFINEKQVKNLYMTTIKIENTGGVVLERENFSAEMNPLRIIGENIESVFIDENNSNFNSTTQIVKKDGEFLINFNWLNPGDYITINVFHENKNSKINLIGSFEKIGTLKEIFIKDLILKRNLPRAIIITILVMVGTLLIVGSVFVISNKLSYGAFLLSFKQRIVCAYVSVLYKDNKKKRVKLLQKVICTKDDEKLQKIMNECGWGKYNEPNVKFGENKNGK